MLFVCVSILFYLALAFPHDCPTGLELDMEKPYEFVKRIVSLDYGQLMHRTGRLEKAKSASPMLEMAIDKSLVYVT